jgi:hypothetical protein
MDGSQGKMLSELKGGEATGIVSAASGMFDLEVESLPGYRTSRANLRPICSETGPWNSTESLGGSTSTPRVDVTFTTPQATTGADTGIKLNPENPISTTTGPGTSRSGEPRSTMRNLATLRQSRQASGN